MNKIDPEKEIEQLLKNNPYIIVRTRKNCPTCKSLVPINIWEVIDWRDVLEARKISLDDATQYMKYFEKFDIHYFFGYNVEFVRNHCFSTYEIAKSKINELHNQSRPSNIPYIGSFL